MELMRRRQFLAIEYQHITAQAARPSAAQLIATDLYRRADIQHIACPAFPRELVDRGAFHGPGPGGAVLIFDIEINPNMRIGPAYLC